MADMSLIKGDGGGTQYTTLEAWDAETVPIIHSGWIRRGDEMRDGKNCLVASSGEDLKRVIRNVCRNEELRERIVSGGLKSLKTHSPIIVVPQILEWLQT